MGILFYAALATPALSGATVPHVLTDKQAAKLLQHATTPEEHRELAEYFHQRAHRMREKQQKCLDYVAEYRLHPPRADLYRNVSTSDYYVRLAGEAEVLANGDDQLAAFHARL